MTSLRLTFRAGAKSIVSPDVIDCARRSAHCWRRHPVSDIWGVDCRCSNYKMVRSLSYWGSSRGRPGRKRVLDICKGQFERLQLGTAPIGNLKSGTQYLSNAAKQLACLCGLLRGCTAIFPSKSHCFGRNLRPDVDGRGNPERSPTTVVT